MPFNAIRTGKNLPLSLTAWRDAYKPLANWPVQKWLQFQTLAPGSLKEGLETLHAFQEEYNIKDAPTQEYMLGWLLKATQWDKASLGSWGAWSTLLSETPMWSLATQAQLMASQAKNLLPVEPEQYDSIAKVQSQLGSYWNKVRSNISAVQGLRDHNKNSAWETYSTFRKELQLGRLLDHSNDVRWNDFCRLSKAPLAWREVLVPLYQDWVQSLPQGVVIKDTAIDLWIDTLESNGVNLMNAPMPSLDESRNYHMWSVPSAWVTNESAEKTFNRVQFLEKLTEISATEFMFDDYTCRSMS